MRTKLSSYLTKPRGIFRDHNEVAITFFFCFLGPVFADGVWSTTSGPLRGTASLVDDVVAFLGVPYAEPPVGDLRFAKPLPKRQWTEVYTASKLPVPCAQMPTVPSYFFPDISNMSEDCLYLNFWVPKTRYTRGLRPIIIFIHGGLFIYGSTTLNVYDGSKLSQQGDVIVATINYRLGSFGFFLANIEDANGNMGMYDQIMAIKWIKDNAMNFGGDPDNIVLMGESAGALSVSAHMVSPLSQHLFKRAIMQSGSILIPNLQDDNVNLFKNSEMVAARVGCANSTTNLQNDPYAVVSCLKSKSTEDLVAAETSLLTSTFMTFFPRVNDEFFPKTSRDLFLEGKFRKDIDVLIGVNSNEGTMLLTIGAPEYFGHYGIDNVQSISKRQTTFLTQGFLTNLGYPDASDIIGGYMQNVRNPSSDSYTQMMANIVGDFLISCATKFNAELFSLKGNNVYFYNLDFRAASTPMAEWVGITHMDELQYVFGNPFHNNFTAEEIELSTRLINRWSSFAKYGNPNIQGHIPWLRYSYQEPFYLNIGQEEETLRWNPVDRCEIWRKKFKIEINARLIRYLQNSGMVGGGWRPVGRKF